jgi:DNA polymerase IV
MEKTIFHIDFNSYFATVEQQANPRLRGKPIGVTGGDRTKRTVIGAASIEAKQFGVKTGMQLHEAKKLCPQIILVPGDSDKYLSCTKKFLNILKDYSPNLEVFSIDEVFLELSHADVIDIDSHFHGNDKIVNLAQQIKSRIRNGIGDWMRVSIGISYNKLLAKLGSNMQKPDGLVIIPDQAAAIKILDNQPLDEICGIGFRIKARLNKMGIFNFKQLREVPKDILLFEFKSYGNFLYNAARGIDERPIMPFYEKPEVKSVGHRHTIFHDTNDQVEIKQILLQLTELIARKLRAKKLVGKTVSCWFRYKIDYTEYNAGGPKPHFEGGGGQNTILDTSDGLDIFKAAWSELVRMWDKSPIRMIGVSISNLKPQTPQNLSFLEEIQRREIITKAIDKINDKYGEFTLQRGILLQTKKLKRMANSFLADRRFKI